MNQYQKVMQQALEALETGGWNQTTQAITALREALAQPAQEADSAAVRSAWLAGYAEGERDALEAQPAQEHSPNDHYNDGWRDALHSVQKASQQPAQEPVVCRFCHDERGEWVWQCNHCGEIDDSREPSPPQRQPLTDEEIMEMFNKVGGATWISDFARAIEAAHGIGVKK